MAFVVHRSNRIEALADDLGRAVAGARRSPFERETIVIQSRGMERWLALHLSRRLGVVAGFEFPFPRVALERVFRVVLGDDDPVSDAWSESALPWAVASVLPGLLAEPGFESVARRLADDHDGVALIELGTELARIFDRYATYRADVVQGWEAGQGRGLQPVLWRALVRRYGAGHFAARAGAFRDRWRRARELPAELPRRLSLFGASSMPPLHLDLFVLLAERVDVHLYCPSPSDQWWGDLRSRRERLRALELGVPDEADADSALLASLGRMGRDFQRLLERAADYVEADRQPYVDPGHGTLLTSVQSDLLGLVSRGHGGEPPARVDPGDRSLEIHGCHSALREVEALHDLLLDALERDPTLQARDIVVMTPDLDGYAPLFEAVFGREPDAPGFIPFRVADRSPRREHAVVDALLALIAVLDRRFTASDVLDLLRFKPVREHLELDVEAVPRLTELVRAAGVRWGVDARDRERVGRPPSARNTWEFGLSRLLAGYAAPDASDERVAGVLPCRGAVGDAAVELGTLIELVDALARAREAAAAPRSLADWEPLLLTLCEAALGGPGPGGDPLAVLRAAFAELRAASERVGFDRAVGLPALASWLALRLDGDRPAHELLSAGVTVCAFLPMRCIPFRVVCLVGMNDGAFPRTSRGLEIDLLLEQPRPGDRIQRDEDRQLFLEALLSARDRLIITYVGRDVQDDSVQPPSVVVAELEDLLQRGYVPDASPAREVEPAPAAAPSKPRRGRGAAVLAGQLGFFAPPAAAPRAPRALPPWRVEHPLHPFSPRYFGAGNDPRLCGFRSADVATARASLAQRTIARFLSAPLAATDVREVDVDRLASAVRDPARALCQVRLGVSLREDLAVAEDREPIELDLLERWRVGDELLRRALAGQTFADAVRVMDGTGALPEGNAGRELLAGLEAEVTELVRLAEPYRAERVAPVALSVDLPGDVGRVVGVVSSLFAGARVSVQWSRVRAKHRLENWVRHVALCAAGNPLPSVLLGRGDNSALVVEHFLPFSSAQARQVLADLVALYRRALSEALPFLPEASSAYVAALLSGKDQQKALAAAEAAATPSSDRSGVPADGYVKLVHGDRSPVEAPEFCELAEAVFRPLTAALREDLP